MPLEEHTPPLLHRFLYRTRNSGDFKIEGWENMTISIEELRETEALRASNNFKEADFKEVCASVRHYSGLRYLIVPIFLAIQGGVLLCLREGLITRFDISSFSRTVVVVPIVFGAIFLVLEDALNKLLNSLVCAINAGWPDSSLAKIPRTRFKVTLSVSLIYIVVSIATSVLLWLATSAKS
jgi:hypothetical protein